jgi:hypothetical protein
MKNVIFGMTPCGIIIDVTEERIASIIRAKRINELATTLAITSYY